MSRADVTPDAYPELFALRAELLALGIESEPRPFDVYQGPYLAVNGLRVWYADGCSEVLIIERPGYGFETQGAEWIEPETESSNSYGAYGIESAAQRIAKIAATK